MDKKSQQWIDMGPAASPEEAQALAAVKSLLADSPTTWAWSNLMFLDPHGRPSEVDIILVNRNGLFVLELKGYHGRIDGDQQEWRLTSPSGSVRSTRNPYLINHSKAQRLKSLLERQQGKAKKPLPWITAITILHGRDSDVHLDELGRANTYGLDGYNVSGLPAFSDLLRAPVDDHRNQIDVPRAKEIVSLMGKAGFKARPKTVMIGQYQVADRDPLREGPDWTDWRVQHPVIKSEHRRVRTYDVPTDASQTRRAEIERAAQREYLLASGLGHPGVIAPIEILTTERGPALVFPDDGESKSLAEYLAANEDRLDYHSRLELVREIGEVLAYAHRNRVHHRALTPAQVYVEDSSPRRITIRDWQTGYQESTATASMTRQALLAGATGLSDLVEIESLVYLAPEAFAASHPDPVALDVYGLAAITYRILTGSAPAANLGELQQRLGFGGLDPAVHSDGVDPEIGRLVVRGTCPDVAERTPDVPTFLTELTAAERDEAAGTFEVEQITDPLEAQPGDLLTIDGNEVLVEERLGSGSTGLALLISDGIAGHEPTVLKVAHDASREDRLTAEADVLAKLDHPRVLRLLSPIREVGRRLSMEVQDAGRPTLGSRIHNEGRLTVEQLQNYGRDLFEAVAYLEQRGIQHRDIKPDNLGVRADAQDRRPRVVLFDFSLANEAPEQIRAGTRPYLDPFLGTAARPRYDSAAERFAVAVTLFQMATAQLPEWGDGGSDPSAIPDEVTLPPIWFEDQVSESLTAFFRIALARDASVRHSDLAEMASSWDGVFTALEPVQTQTATGDDSLETPDLDEQRDALAAKAAPSTAVRQAGLSAKAVSALDRIGVATVGELLATPGVAINQLPGVGVSVRREIQRRRRQWAQTLGGGETPEPVAFGRGVEQVASQLVPKANGKNADAVHLAQALLETSASEATPWPTWDALYARAGLNSDRAENAKQQLLKLWGQKEVVTDIRLELHAIVDSLTGIATVDELAARLVTTRGSNAEGAQRARNALPLIRVACEVDDAEDQLLTQSRSSDEQEVLIVSNKSTDGIDPATRVAAVRHLGDNVGKTALVSEVPLRPIPSLALVTGDSLAAGAGITDPVRLLQVAAAVSHVAAVSTRGELYLRGLAPAASVGAVVTAAQGTRIVGEDWLRRTVAARFPFAEPLPQRPALDAIVEAVMPGLSWDGRAFTRPGTQASKLLPSATRFVSQHEAGQPSFDALDEQLKASIRSRGALVLATEPNRLTAAPEALANRYGVEIFNVTTRLLAAMREFAGERGIDWAFLLGVDAEEPSDYNRKMLAELVRASVERIWQPVLESPKPLVLTDVAPLARYGAMDRIGRLTDAATARPAARWIIVPRRMSAGPPILEHQPVPLVAGLWVDLPIGMLNAAKART